MKKEVEIVCLECDGENSKECKVCKGTGMIKAMVPSSVPSIKRRV